MSVTEQQICVVVTGEGGGWEWYASKLGSHNSAVA